MMKIEFIDHRAAIRGVEEIGFIRRDKMLFYRRANEDDIYRLHIGDVARIAIDATWDSSTQVDPYPDPLWRKKMYANMRRRDED